MNSLNSINSTKATYLLLSDGGYDSIQAEWLINKLGKCKVTKVEKVSTGDAPIHIRMLMLNYPMLHVISSCTPRHYVGYEAIEKYVNQIITKNIWWFG